MSNPNVFKKQKERAFKRKLELIELLGGKCSECGYDKNYAALDLHHLNPDEKDFELNSRLLSNTNIDKILAEAKKCVLLCANCHREKHYPQFDKNNSQTLINSFESINKSVLEPKNKIVYCSYCNKKFKYVKGKKFCSDTCYELSKNYPMKEDILNKHLELKTWSGVCEYYNLTYKVLKKIVRND